MRKEIYEKRKLTHQCTLCGAPLPPECSCSTCEKCRTRIGKTCKARYKKLKEKNICVKCGKNKPLEGQTLCLECRKYYNEYNSTHDYSHDVKAFHERLKKLRLERRKKHLCTRCGTPLPEGSPYIQCSVCRAANNERRKAALSLQKRGLK